MSTGPFSVFRYVLCFRAGLCVGSRLLSFDFFWSLFLLGLLL